MTSPPEIFDEALRRRRRDRASRLSEDERIAPLFALHDHVASGLVERLAPIQRRFAHVLIAAATTPAYTQALSAQPELRRLTLLEDAPHLAERLRRRLAPGATLLQGGLGTDFTGDVSFPQDGFDLVLIGPDLHARNDPIAALAQALALLKPDGLLLAAMFGGDSLMELRHCLAEAEIEICGGLSPRVAPMGEIRDLGALLQRAGFALPVADSERLEIWHRSPLHLMQEIRAVGESNVLMGRRKRFLRRDVLARCLELYQQKFSRPDGKTRTTLELVTLTGWAPDASQQKPLRPGSANTRLAEALGTEEKSAETRSRPATLRRRNDEPRNDEERRAVLIAGGAALR